MDLTFLKICILSNGLNISHLSYFQKLVRNCRKHIEINNTTDDKIRKPSPSETSTNMEPNC